MDLEVTREFIWETLTTYENMWLEGKISTRKFKGIQWALFLALDAFKMYEHAEGVITDAETTPAVVALNARVSLDAYNRFYVEAEEEE